MSEQVMLDRDLAELYGVETKVLNQAVKRNRERFPEHGVVMLSSILRSDKAAEINIKVVRAFIEMHKFIQSDNQLICRLDKVELKQIEAISRLDGNDQKFDKIFSLMESGDIKPKQGILFDKQVFDAYKYVLKNGSGSQKWM